MARCFSIALAVLISVTISGNAAGGAPPNVGGFSNTENILGAFHRHVVKKEETLLDIARMYDLGFNEIQDLYPDWDPWLPPPGATITIPSRWIIPGSTRSGILINTAELRLYFFDEKRAAVSTFPIGIGDPQFPTPLGEFRISAKIFRPTWTVPPSLRDKYAVWTVPAGPENPLGDYWLGLGDSGYGIHGTNFAWSIGRPATRGCIRLYPEDIRLLFDLVEKGTPVSIVYEPVKIGRSAGSVFVEIHKDIYGKMVNLQKHALDRLDAERLLDLIDLDKLNASLQHRSGIPRNITRSVIPTPQ